MKVDNSLPNRISMNVSIGKQTQGSTFGEKVNQGLQAAGSALASGASLLGGVIPGAGVISAAVNSAAHFSNLPGGSASSAAYASTGALTLGGGALNTTVGSGGVAGVGGGGGVNLGSGSTNSTIGVSNNEIADMSNQNAMLLRTQMLMQRESQTFMSVSNVLKTKHDTLKNTISNVR